MVPLKFNFDQFGYIIRLEERSAIFITKMFQQSQIIPLFSSPLSLSVAYDLRTKMSPKKCQFQFPKNLIKKSLIFFFYSHRLQCQEWQPAFASPANWMQICESWLWTWCPFPACTFSCQDLLPWRLEATWNIEPWPCLSSQLKCLMPR